MIPKQFNDITKTDIDALVTNSVAEGRTIDYKRTLPGGGDEDKREFLADVSSFANAAGGDIIYGVEEDKGVPTATNGLACIDPDKEILRLDSCIRNGIEPRVPGVQIKAVVSFPNGPVIVLRVPKSWSSPHMVTFKNCSRFFSRTNAGKFQMDVTEIRAGFLMAEAIPERIRRFRDDRLSKIVAGETPLPMGSGAKVILHLLPVSSFSKPENVDVAAVWRDRNQLPPLGNTDIRGRMNLDGCVTFPYIIDGVCPSYTQLFRNGTIEAVDGFALTGKDIPAGGCESDIISGVCAYLKLFRQLGIEPPVIVMLSMIGVKGCGISTGPQPLQPSFVPIVDRDVLLLPEVVFQDLGDEPASVLQPIFDALWQSAGFERSPNYNATGQWSLRH